jgi:hypothetical protein
MNVPLDGDRGGSQPVSADTINAAMEVGWQFRTWLLWDKNQAGAVRAAAASILSFYRGSWRRSGPAAIPHQTWLESRSVARPGHERPQISRAVP